MMLSVEEINTITADRFPGYCDFVATESEKGRVVAHFDVQDHHLAPNGYLHAASIVMLADTACGMGARSVLPDGASGFTTIELKSNYLGTAREGRVEVVAEAIHAGRTTQVWDAIVTHVDTGKTIALFRCTQSVLWKS